MKRSWRWTQGLAAIGPPLKLAAIGPPLKLAAIGPPWKLAAIGPALGLVQVAGMAAVEVGRGRRVDWAEMGWTFLGVALWGLFIPALVRAAEARQDAPASRGNLARWLGGHAARAVAISLTTAVLYVDLRMVAEMAGGAAFRWRWMLEALLSGALLEDLVIYAAIVGISDAVFSQARLRREAVRQAELEAALVQAELQMLRSQLDPHFMFNALNSIAALTRRDPAAAERMVVHLGDFLRLTLRGDGRQEVSLREELAHLDSYLDIQRVRFRDRLRIETCIAPAALACLVPHLVLQPLVENALKHGMESRDRLDVRIAARRREGDASFLVLEVEDDGPGPRLGEDGLPGAGVGLSTTRRRLEKLYGRGQELAVAHRGDGRTGARVTVVVPWRRAAAGGLSVARADAAPPAAFGAACGTLAAAART